MRRQASLVLAVEIRHQLFCLHLVCGRCWADTHGNRDQIGDPQRAGLQQSRTAIEAHDSGTSTMHFANS